jgi:ribose/xylose/arabinose/galactoside ABC-type transport system permease subunit
LLEVSGGLVVVYPAVCLASLADGVVLDGIEEKLPEERESRFWAMGTAACAVLLFATWAADPASPPQPGAGPVLIHLVLGAALGWIYGVLLDRMKRGTSGSRAALTWP